MPMTPAGDPWIRVDHEAPSAALGSISVVPIGYEPVDGYAYIERDAQSARVVLHENLGLHLETAGVDVHDQALPSLVEAELRRVFDGGWTASAVWSPLEDQFIRDVQVHVEPPVPLAGDRTDLEVAQALLPAIEALYAAIEPSHPLYVFRRVAERQMPSESLPTGPVWETVAAPPAHRQEPLGHLSHAPSRPLAP